VRPGAYNLGDIIGGNAEWFKASCVENAVTSNAVLAPLANRSQQDIRTFLRLAETGERDTDGFEGRVDLELGPAQRLIVHLDKCAEVDPRRVRALLQSCGDKPTTRAVLAACLKADETAGQVQLSHLDFCELIVHAGPVPTVRLCWRAPAAVAEAGPPPLPATTPSSVAPPPLASSSRFGQCAAQGARRTEPPDHVARQGCAAFQTTFGFHRYRASAQDSLNTILRHLTRGVPFPSQMNLEGSALSVPLIPGAASASGADPIEALVAGGDNLDPRTALRRRETVGGFPLLEIDRSPHGVGDAGLQAAHEE
jgi:hypothetical protein